VGSKPLTIEQILTLLAETPSHITALTAGLAPAQLHTAPSPGEWSARDVLAHLLAILKPLPPEGWTRTATVIDMVGRQFERTVYYYAEWLAHHERPHIKQIERIVNTMHMYDPHEQAVQLGPRLLCGFGRDGVLD
jgi:hypothetical protein